MAKEHMRIIYVYLKSATIIFGEKTEERVEKKRKKKPQ